MGLQDLQTQLQQQVKANGAIAVSEATLNAAELTPCANFDQIIQSYLKLSTPLSVTVTAAIPAPQANTLNVSGNASFLGLKAVPVQLVFTLEVDQTVNLLLLTALLNDWQFSRSFPMLSDSPFTELQFGQPCYLLTTAKQILYTWNSQTITLQQGLNFASNLKLGESLAILQDLIENLTEDYTIVFTGTINSNVKGDLELCMPVLSLTGTINEQIKTTHTQHFQLSLPQVLLKSYLNENGFLSYWLIFSATFSVDNTPFNTIQAAITQNSPSLNLSMLPPSSKEAITPEKIVELIGGVDFTASIPDEFRQVFSSVGLVGLSTTINLKTGNITMLSGGIGTGANQHWRMMDDFILENMVLNCMVLSPFDQKKKRVFINFSATAQIFPKIFKDKNGADGGITVFEITLDEKKAISSISANFLGRVSLNDLIAELSQQTIEIPKTLADIAFDDFGMSFIKNTTNNKYDYTLHGSAQGTFDITLVNKPLVVTFQAIVDSATKSYSLIGGLLLNDASFFEAKVSLSGGKQILSGTWNALHDDYLQFEDIAKAFGFTPPEIPKDLDLSLKSATLTYDFTDEILILGAESVNYGKAVFVAFKNQAAPTPGWQFFFGLAVNSINLSNVPLINKTLPSNETLKVEKIQVLIASAPLSNPQNTAEITLINTQINNSGKDYPAIPIQGLPSEFALSAQFDFVSYVFPLSIGAGGASMNTNAPAQNTIIGTPTGANPTIAPQPVQADDGTTWFNVQQILGPINFQKVGVKYKESVLWFLLNASLTTAGLEITMMGLSVGSPLKDFKPQFNIEGLGIEYKNDAIEIAGDFLKLTDPKTQITQYAGLAVLRAEAFSLSAIGMYGTLHNSATNTDETSLFLYATLGYPLGGPPFFFVTGLAAGFGYNRALVAPTIDQVVNFPLVTQAMGDPAPLPADATAKQALLTQKLQSLNRYVPITSGQMFFAVGIRFTSFKMVDAFALLMIQFGQRTEIDLLGLATLVVPTPPEEGEAPPALAEAQLALKATYIPADGILSLEAQLTAASFVFDRACHITGGFAFYSWLSGEHAGDFVLTLGGYHPHFQVPTHYPQRVPRLGINWQILPPNPNPEGLTTRLTITGQAYYALTAHALMAGGGLAADYRSDWVHAWFKAGADFLITWQPYHYEASMYIALGAEVTLSFIHISFDAGADLTLWGPPFGGHANIHLRICGIKVSFDVDFGGSPVGAKPIEWLAFKKAFLPDDTQICSISVQHGLVRQITSEADKTERWIVNPQSFALITNTVIPVKTATAGAQSTGGSGANQIPLTNDKGQVVSSLGEIAVQPINVTASDFTSTYSITIQRNGTTGTVENDFVYATVLKQVPTGLWGTPVMDGEFLAKPDENAPRFVENALCGLIISPKPPTPSKDTHSIDREKLQFESTNYDKAQTWDVLDTQTIKFYATPDEDKAAWQKVDITDSTTVKNRNEMLTALGFSNAALDFGQPPAQFGLSAPQIFKALTSTNPKS